MSRAQATPSPRHSMESYPISHVRLFHVAHTTVMGVRRIQTVGVTELICCHFRWRLKVPGAYSPCARSVAVSVASAPAELIACKLGGLYT